MKVDRKEDEEFRREDSQMEGRGEARSRDSGRKQSVLRGG
jgi:hypothetical protein